MFQTKLIHLFKGMRVKPTFTLNAAGTSAPMFISVYGLTERELHFDIAPTGFLVMKVKGLCVGGFGVAAECNTYGYVLLIRAENRTCKDSVDRVRYRYYRDTIFLPFVSSCRKHLNWEEGTPIPERLRAAAWNDGDAEQIKVLNEPESIEK